MGSLPETFKKVVSFLEKEKLVYLIIGGIASAILGEPRMTQDVDICISINKKDVKGFLKKAKKMGFIFNEKKSVSSAEKRGVFKILWKGFRIDFIILSTEFEKNAIARGRRITLYGVNALFPTPEDLILFKIVPNRPIDIADIENIARRHSGKLDRKYLEKWAMELSDEAEDMRIYQEVQRILRI